MNLSPFSADKSEYSIADRIVFPDKRYRIILTTLTAAGCIISATLYFTTMIPDVVLSISQEHRYTILESAFVVFALSVIPLCIWADRAAIIISRKTEAKK